MNKILVLYKSKYGATKTYATMLKEELSCDVFDLSNFKKSLFEKYDCIIFAGAIYAGKIAGLDFLHKNYENLRHKKIAILCVGASPFDEKAIEEVKTRHLQKNLKNIPFFYARGTWDESRMTFQDRIMCKMLQKVISHQETASCEPWMKELLCSQGKVCDWIDKKFILPLLEYVRVD